MPPSVAIIMRAKNEMPYVRDAVDLLKQQTWSSFDLFAVDSGSTDGTLGILQESCANLRQINPDQYIPGKVLNDAISQTDHEIIVLLNADAIPQSTDWLENLISPIMDNRAEATFSKQVARPDAHFIVTYDYERAYSSLRIDPEFFSAVACAFRRDLWQQAAFRETGYAEDMAWASSCRNKGARFLLQESSVVEHSHNYTLRELHNKRYRQAITFNEKPRAGHLCYQCLREILRDLLHATARGKLHTIPYNMAYRVTIYRGIYFGLRDGRRQVL